MKKNYLLFAAVLVLVTWPIAGAMVNPILNSQAPVIADQGGPDAFGYRWIDNDSAGGPAYNWIDITAIGTQVQGLGDDNNIGQFPIGFSFPYYWYTVNHTWIGSNGYIEFLNNYNYASPFANIPTAAAPNDYLAPNAADLDFSGGNGSCYYYSNNADTFIVSWIGVPEYGFADSVHTFQLILAARDSSITFQYGANIGYYSSANVVGIENVNGQVGIQYLRNQLPVNHLVHDGLALKFYPIPNPGFVVHDAGILDAFQDGSGANFIRRNEGYTIRALVKNFGNQTEASIRCSCIIKRNTTTVFSDTINVPSLNPGQSNWMDFPDFFVPDRDTTFKVTFATLMSPDANSTNNTLIAELESYSLPQKFLYDDGIAETGRSWTGDFSGFAVEFQIPDAVRLDTAYIHINSVSLAGPLYVWVLPDNGEGRPDGANILAGDTIDVSIAGWVTVDFTAANLLFAPNAKYFIVGVHAFLSTFTFSVDQTVPLSFRGWEFTGGYAPDRDRTVSDIMFRTYCSSVAPGVISGSVFDEDATLQGVVITTFDNTDAIVAIDTSGTSGEYLVPLPGGTYHELFQKSGYRDTTIQNIVVNYEQTTTLDVIMQSRGGCQYTLGDVNGSGTFNGIDVTYGVGYFKGGAVPPIVCDCPPHGSIYAAGDVNGNCAFNGIDVTYMVGYFKGGPAPIPCPDCPPAVLISPSAPSTEPK
jgi:hypothetical protein